MHTFREKLACFRFWNHSNICQWSLLQNKQKKQQYLVGVDYRLSGWWVVYSKPSYTIYATLFLTCACLSPQKKQKTIFNSASVQWAMEREIEIMYLHCNNHLSPLPSSVRLHTARNERERKWASERNRMDKHFKCKYPRFYIHIMPHD